MSLTRSMWVLLAVFACSCARAGIDHEVRLDQSGIWARSYQTDLEIGVVAVEVAGALWFGNDEPRAHLLADDRCLGPLRSDRPGDETRLWTRTARPGE